MTTEDDFQAALDANPDDWQTRLVLADFLQEQGDPRAEGYRALAAGRLHPGTWDGHRGPDGSQEILAAFYCVPPSADGASKQVIARDELPRDWFNLIEKLPVDIYTRLRSRLTRRDMEDAAAVAFAALGAERRAQLLAASIT